MRRRVLGRRPSATFGALLACLALMACAPDPGAERQETLSVNFLDVEVTPAPNPLGLLDDPDPRLAANKRLVFDMWRSIVNAGHIELADEMLREDYIQHSPVLPTGRAAFKQVFSVIPRRDIPELVSPPLVAILAEGDLVVMALREELGGDGGEEPYTSTHFNLFRVEDGRLAEHWHSVTDAPGAEVLSPEKGGPQPVSGAIGAAQFALLEADDPALAANKRLVFDALRDLYDGNQLNLADRYLADVFIEHDPNGFAGRERANTMASDENSLALPLVSMIAQGDLVVAVMARSHSHPVHEDQIYNTVRFEMFRIEDGRIAEHWNGATRGSPRLLGEGDAA